MKKKMMIIYKKFLMLKAKMDLIAIGVHCFSINLIRQEVNTRACGIEAAYIYHAWPRAATNLDNLGCMEGEAPTHSPPLVRVHC